MPVEKGELIERPDYDVAVASDAGAGFEEMGKADLAIPYVKLLQGLSPEVQPDRAEFNEDARAGYFYNSVTQEVYGDTIDVIVAAYRRAFNEWDPNQRGSLRASYDPRSLPGDIERVEVKPGKFKNVRHSNGNYIEESMYYYILTGEGFVDQAVFSFHGTGLKRAKMFNSTMMAQRTDVGGKSVLKPIYSSIWRMSSSRESNNLGSWYGLTIKRVGDTPMELYSLAKLFNESAFSRKIKGEAEDDDGAADAVAKAGQHV